MPNHVTNEVIFRDLTDEIRDRLLSVCCNEVGDVDFERLVPVPLNIWHGSVGTKHEKAFRDTALDWCTKNWGTKWNAYRCSKESGDGTLTLRFETAWRPPYGWLVAVFNRFKISFDHNWLDEGAERGVCGRFNYAALGDFAGDPWSEQPADDEMQKHLHVLRWGVESFEKEGDGVAQGVGP